MLRSLQLRNFTVFKNAKLEFGSGLNVVVGENGTGKSHLLKAAYSGLAVSAARSQRSNGDFSSKSQWQSALAEKLIGVFRPDSLNRLVRRKLGRGKCDLVYEFDRTAFDLGFSFSTQAKAEVRLLKTPAEGIPKRPVYLPTRDVEYIPRFRVSLRDDPTSI